MAAAVNDSEEMLSAINVTPFVDIVLVLLIILMVTSVQIVKASLTVDLPTAASGGKAVDSTLNVVVDAQGALLLDGAPTTEQALIQRVRAERSRNPKLQAVIAADRTVVYDRVIHLIDIVKTNGVTSFALNIQRAPTSQDVPGAGTGAAPGAKVN